MRIIFLLSIFFLLVSCGGGKEKLPKDILKESDMREVLWDLTRADEFVVTFVKDSSVDIKKERIKLYEEIFKIHHTNLDQVKKSLSYYQATPERFAPIADSLAKRQLPNNNYGQSQQNDTLQRKGIKQVPFGNNLQ